jgi:regulator of replication initiation timing
MEQSGTDIISLILSNTKDAKISLNKLIEQNKQLMRENERLSQDMSSSNKKAMNNEQTLSQQIQQIQEELVTVYSAKEQEMIKN